MTDLISAWRSLPLETPPYVLPSDLAVLGDSDRHSVTFGSWETYLEGCLEKATDSRFHLGLLPQPWHGDLLEATVFILMLNPGLGPGDYFGEYRVPAFRAALISNIRQEANRGYPLISLNPEFSWHSGADYWRTRLHWLARSIAREQGITNQAGVSLLARRVCCVQLVPYHSTVYGLSTRLLHLLESTRMVKAFVREHLISRPELLILVTRQTREWDLPDGKNVIKYEGTETRAAHLSPRSRGGQALAVHFGLRAT